jgi:hypothetical protein
MLKRGTLIIIIKKSSQKEGEKNIRQHVYVGAHLPILVHLAALFGRLPAMFTQPSDGLQGPSRSALEHLISSRVAVPSYYFLPS